MSTGHAQIREADTVHFHNDGFMILPAAVGEDDLAMLQGVCDRLLGPTPAEVPPGDHPKPIFLNMQGWNEPSMRSYLYGPLAAEICRATLGDSAYLFWEHFVIKTPERGGIFSWHQDSGYMDHPHRPYMNMWCALDDVDENNGTLYLLPQSEVGGGEVVDHVHDERTGDKVGYDGPATGVPVIGPAGTLAVFSSLTFHRSSANRSGRVRRTYAAQYSPEPILNAEGTALRSIAVALLQDGQAV